MATLIDRRSLGHGIVAALLVTVILLVILLIVLGSMVGFVVDWLWFSAVGYLNVFWTIIAAKAELFLAVFVTTASILWLNGALAFPDRRHLPANLPGDFQAADGDADGPA